MLKVNRIAERKRLEKVARWQAKEATAAQRFDSRAGGLVAEIEALLASDAPIVVGPWLGEVGFEVLYWIPILRWAVHRWPSLRERLVVVSRGGVDSWYHGVTERYLDIFDLYDYETYSRHLHTDWTERRSTHRTVKQIEPTTWESAILSWAAGQLGVPAVSQLHPGWAHRARNLAVALSKRSDFAYARWPSPELGDLVDVLPDDYIAARFYLNVALRGDGAQDLAQIIVATLARHVPVVLLNTGEQIDPKHPDLDIPGVIQLAPHMTLRNNLAIQSVALANARAFVGTYGGLSYVPPHFGTATFACMTTMRYVVDTHHNVAQRVFNRSGWGGYQTYLVHDEEIEELVGRVLQTRQHLLAEEGAVEASPYSRHEPLDR